MIVALLLFAVGVALIAYGVWRGASARPGEDRGGLALALWGMVALVASLAIWTADAAAQAPAGERLPRALNRQECSQVGDLVWLARVMHKRGVAPALAREVLLDVYVAVFIPDARAQAYVDAAVRFGAGPFGADVEPGVVGMHVYMECIRHQGRLDKVFGVSL